MSLEVFYKHFMSKRILILFLVILMLQITGSCATQNKYRKHRAVPCPCETNFRR